jgi:hypothetical protein
MSDRKSVSKGLPECVVEYVRQLLKKMRYRRKVRDDVEAELTAHFEDELKDCKTSEEKEQKAKLLLSDFGDFKLLAILLRRAKKRCRPLWRTIAARTFQAIGVLIVCFIFYVIWFSFGEPTIRIDYVKLFNRMNQPDILQQDNAWPYYEKAIELYVPQNPIAKKFVTFRDRGKPRQDALRLKDMLKDNEKQIQVWIENNKKYWDNFNPEQQSVILKCLEYDWVPFPKIVHQDYNDWQATPFNYMTEHVIRCISENTELTEPHPRGLLSSRITEPHPRGLLPSSVHPEFPTDELKEWLKQRKIPADFMQAVSVAVLQEAIKQYSNLSEDIRGEISDVELEYIGPWVRQNEAAWLEFAAGSARSYCYRPLVNDPDDQDKSLWSIPMPPLSSLRDLARMGIWHSRIERAEGKLRQSIDDCLAVTRSAVHWQGKGTIVEQLVGASISNLGHEEILSILADRELSNTELKRLYELLSRIYPGDYPLLNMEGERLMFMDVVQHSFTDGGPGGGHLIPGTWDHYTDSNPSDVDETDKRIFMPLFTAASMVHARRYATVAKANEIYDLQIKNAKMTPYQRHVSDIKTADEMYESLQNYRFFLLQIFMPATARISEIIYRGKMGHEATKTIIAILQWRQEKDQYPATLGDLVKTGFLEELPMDVFSDKPLVYKKTDDDFILYSVGPNFVDDGGEHGKDRNGNFRKWSDNGDTLFWPVIK